MVWIRKSHTDYEFILQRPLGRGCGVNYSQLLFEKECNLQLDAVFRDLSLIVQLDLLILNPCGLEVLERFLSARDTYLYGIIKTLRGRCHDLGYFCD
jgi:hypothetical protein